MRASVFTCAMALCASVLVSVRARAQSADHTSNAPATAGESPLTLHVGDSDLVIGGFVDAMIAMRSRATGNGLPTSFGTIPFGNVPQGHLSETEFSAQNSRVSLQATGAAGSLNVRGYPEVDFGGSAPNAINVTSNSNTLRMRLYWAQVTSGKFEFLAGQSWSLLTPNRNGLSPMPADVFFSQTIDTNFQMGLTWTRAAQFRFIAHPNDRLTAGVALENPEQYVGSAVVLPASFPVFEVSNGSATTTTPNRHPDVIGKVAFDPRAGGMRQHVEAAVLIRGFKTYDPASGATFTKTGTGVEIGANVEPLKGLHVVSSAFFSSGGGRYIANVNGPDFIVNPDASLTLVGATSVLSGAELAVRKTMVYGYYSWATLDQRTSSDVDGGPIGFGMPAPRRRITRCTKQRSVRRRRCFAIRRSARFRRWRSTRTSSGRRFRCRPGRPRTRASTCST